MRMKVSAYSLEKISLIEPDRVKSIIQNVSIILRTIAGTVPLYREFGVDRDMLDRPLPVAKAMMTTRVREAVERFEPRVIVRSVTCQEDSSVPGRLIPTVEVEIEDE